MQNITVMEYCRLCVKKNPLSELSTFENGSELWQKLIDKLSRFNIILEEKILPRTVCFWCSNSLESAFAFVTMVEHAQATLSNCITVQVKSEEIDADHVYILNDLPDDSTDNADDTDEEPNIKTEHPDEDVSIARYDSDHVNEINEPLVNEVFLTDIKKNEVTSMNEVKCNVEVKHQSFTANKTGEDKTVNSSENIDIEEDKNKVDTNITTSTPEVSNGNKDYSAEYINEQINRLAMVPLHTIKATWQEFIWKCSYCETQFPNVDELQTHSKQYHNTCNTYQCTDCNIKRSNLNVFLKHVRKHRKYLHYSCYICYRKFPNPQECRLHKRIHYTSDYICLGCNATFPSRDELESHINAFFKMLWSRKNICHSLDGNFTCNVCEKSFKSSFHLSRHLVAHTNRNRDHFCDTCGKGFYNKATLINHMIGHSEAKPYQCEICKYKFKHLYTLRYHSKVHTGEKPFKCDQCDRCFRLQKQLIKHSDTHSNLLPHACTQCDKKFRNKEYLKIHMRQHTGEKPYLCEICERTFACWSNYNKHMKRKHGTDKSKRKRTPLGPHAVDPTTGDVIYPEMDKVLKWKEKMKQPLRARKRQQVQNKELPQTPLKNM